LVVDADGQHASTLAAVAQAAAHRLNHLQAGLVVRCAADANAVGQHLARVFATIKTALTTHCAALGALDAAGAAFELPAQILELRAGGLVFALTVDLAAVAAFFDADFTALNETLRGYIRRRTGCRTFAALLGRRAGTFFQNCIRHIPTLSGIVASLWLVHPAGNANCIVSSRISGRLVISVSKRSSRTSRVGYRICRR
jgi:hypothetical protein